MSETKTFEFDHAEFSEELTMLSSFGVGTSQVIYRLLCKATKALIYRREGQYLEIVLDRIAKHAPTMEKPATKWVKAVIDGVFRYNPVIDRISTIGDEEAPATIAGIAKARGRHLVEIAPYTTEAWEQAERVLEWIESYSIHPQDLDAHLPKRVAKKSNVYQQAIDFAKSLGRKLDKPTEVGKLTADQRQKMHSLLESFRQIMPGILD